MRPLTIRLVALLTGSVTCASLSAQEQLSDLANELRKLDTRVLPKSEDGQQMLAKCAHSGIREANRGDLWNWHQVQSREAWEKLRNERIKKLRDSLGPVPEVDAQVKLHVTGTIKGAGYVVENIIFESRPGIWVTANLYRPDKPRDGTPGIVICHSHHNSKTQGELQEMGIGWAKQGATVIVPDMLGHGERRQHPFIDAASYPGPFRVGRQDYYFRYNIALQLHLVGESLIGWMVHDLRRCVDLLLQHAKVDPGRIALLGSVAGGGDPAAVAGALDPRFKVVAPFNFGGPQPESPYPLPDDVELSFNYAGSGSWESTRNLRLSAHDRFLPWVIVGAIAPRKLIYAHEFSWHQGLDPVWKRLEQIYSLYNARDNLAAAHGRGVLSGKPPEATHCNNIGPEHLRSMASALKKWLSLDPPDAGGKRHTADELRCLGPDAPIRLRPLHEVLGEIADQRMRDAGKTLSQLPPQQRSIVAGYFAKLLLGDIEPAAMPPTTTHSSETAGAIKVKRITVNTQDDIVVPIILLIPRRDTLHNLPVVIAFSQDGKSSLLKRRASEVGKLLEAGVTVCLPDLRGAGETQPGNGRGRTSSATAISATELMLGRTLLGGRVKDLRTVLAYLRTRTDVIPDRIALWGDSSSEPNPGGQELAAPLDAEKLPRLAEPMGDMVAILTATLDEQIVAIYTRGGVRDFRDALNSPYLYLPHDAVVPQFLLSGDMPKRVELLGSRPVARVGLVDARNRPVGPESRELPAQWLMQQLKR